MPTSYDELPYQSVAFAQTHPDRLATVATLLGLQPPRIDKARVLELGCAAGGNLIPLAESLPEAKFVGVDLSERQIADGQKVVARLGLGNIRLEHGDVSALTPAIGTFDYILCHGVYSWVPRAVQDAILGLCKSCLAPDGVAFISYNTLPGWRMRGMIRDMMLYHANQFPEPRRKVEQGLALIDFLVQSSATQQTPYATYLKSELEQLRKRPESYIFHEYLETDNEPMYFYQFMERASGFGFRYLGDAEVPTMAAGNFPPAVQEVLSRLSTDTVHTEQYMDFLRNRTFRQTLLVHDDQQPQLRVGSERLSGLFIASPARPASAQPDLTTNAMENFQCPNGVTLNCTEPIVKAALIVLAESWPRRIKFSKLCSAARVKLASGPAEAGRSTAQDTQMIGETLLKFYIAQMGLVELSTRALDGPAKPGDRPAVAPLARLQAEAGPQVTNRRHENINLGEFERQLAARLDGTRDRPALVQMMLELVNKGALNAQRDGKPITDEGELRQVLAVAVDRQLSELYRHSLLVA